MNATPAAAQNTVTIWSTTLDVQNYDYTRAHFGHIVGRGCTEPRFVSTTYRCRGALTDDSFSYGGQTYRVAVLQHTNYLFSGTRRNQIDIALDRNIPAAIAERATLVVGSTRWPLADGAVGGFSVYRNGVEDASLGANGYSWLGSLPASGRVHVRLEMPAPGVPYVDPGAGRNTVWSSTLTVDEDAGRLGCDTFRATQDNCSSALADDDFEYKGVTYRVRSINYFSAHNLIRLSLDPSPLGRLSGLELHLGPTRVALGAESDAFRWNGVNPQWSDGQQVGVRLTAPAPSPALSASGPTLSASGAPREGAAPVTVTVTLPEPALDGGVNVTVNLGGTATWGEDYRTPVPAGPEYDDYRRPVRNEGKGWFGRTSSETVQAANLLHIPSGSRSASFEIHVVDDPHEDSGETIDIGVRADHAGIQYDGRQIENCPTCSRRTSLLTYQGAAELTLTITNHEDAETEAARLAAEAEAEAERQRLAAARAAAGGPLSGLALSAGSQAVALVPAFSPNVLSYQAEVPAGTAGVTLAPHWGAEAELGGSPSVVLVSQGPAAMLAQAQVHASGTAAALALSSAGPTRLEVTVLEPDGSGKRLQGTTTTYRIEVAEVVGAAVPQTPDDEQTPPAQTLTTGGDGTPGGGGGSPSGDGGGGGAPPTSPSPEEPQDPEQTDECGDNDRENLVSFYDATDGDNNWLEKTNWKSSEPLDQWYGVDTDEDGEVVSLRLADNNLSGQMPTKELRCLNEDTELKELALWGNEDLLGDEPEGFVFAIERAVLRDIAETIDLNPEWFDDYEEPSFNFEDWHEGVVMTDEDGRVTGLDFTGEDITGEIPGSVFELENLTVIRRGCEVTLEVEAPGRVSVMPAEDCPEETAPEDMEEMEEEETAASGGGGCVLGQEDSSVSGFGLFLVTIFVFAALVRKRVLVSRLAGNRR